MSTDATHYDIAVIGAGVAGLSAAYFLSNDANVVVLERETQPAYHSSGRSAAMFIEGYENRVVSEITSDSADFFRTPPEGFADNPLLGPLGGMTAAGPGELDKLRRYLDVWQPRCAELKEITVEEARAMVPILRDDWLSGAAYDPTWDTIDVHELITGYRRGLRANGGELVTNSEVTALRHGNGRWTISHRTAGGAEAEATASTIVNASGSWANTVATTAGLDPVDLTPMRRTAAIVAAPDGATGWPIVHTIDEQLYFKPESGGLMVCPQDETPSEPMDAFPEDVDVAIALERFGVATNHEVAHVSHTWAGLRTFAQDRHPVVGFDPRATGFFWLAGQGGFGVQTSPAMGAMVASIINRGEQPREEVDATRLVG